MGRKGSPQISLEGGKDTRLRRQTQRTFLPGLHGTSHTLLLTDSCDQPRYTVEDLVSQIWRSGECRLIFLNHSLALYANLTSNSLSSPGWPQTLSSSSASRIWAPFLYPTSFRPKVLSEQRLRLLNKEGKLPSPVSSTAGAYSESEQSLGAPSLFVRMGGALRKHSLGSTLSSLYFGYQTLKPQIFGRLKVNTLGTCCW